MAFLELKNIHKSFYLSNQEFKVLKGIDLQFNHGEFVSILGESGGGKTTLMNIIGGLDGSYTGDVYLNGNSLKNDTTKQLDNYRRKTIGFVFQNFNLIPHLTVLGNVLVALEMTDMSKQEQHDRAMSLLKRVGLGEHVEKHPGQLSGGQKQRVSIARALASNPDVIIADEPTGALDAQNTQEVLELLDSIAKEGKLIITVTHSDKVANFGTRIVHMSSGQIDQDKKLKEPYNAENEHKMNLKPLSFMNTMKMALQQMRYNLARNILIIFGGMIGIFSVIFMLGLGNGVRGYINHQIYSQIKPNAVQVTQKNADMAKIGQYGMQNKDFDRLGKIDHVSKVQKGSMALGAQITKGKNSQTAQQLTTYNDTMLDKNISAGHKPGNGEIMIPKSVAQKFNKNDYKSIVGKNVTLTFTVSQKGQQQPTPLTKTLKVGGISDSAIPAAATNYNTMNKIYQSNHIKMPNNFGVAVTSGGVANVQPVQNKIKSLTNDNGKKSYNISGVGSIVSTLNTYVNMAVYVLAAIAGISLLVSAIMIIVVLYISVSERTQEIGILRALGVTKGNVRNLFINQAFLLGLFSSVAATIVAYLIEWGINSAVGSSIGYDIIQISPGNAAFGIIIAIVINLLSAIIPASKGAKLDPVDTL